MTHLWLIIARAVHFSSCLLLVGVCFFDRFVAHAVIHRGQIAARQWRSIAHPLLSLALPAALLSGVAWFALVTIEMSDLPPSQALRLPILRLVLTTTFGQTWQWRALFWLIAACSMMAWFLSRATSLRAFLAWLNLISSALLAASLAWAGHGLEGTPRRWHLLADALHLLVAGIWPVGLLPFALLLLSLRRTTTGDKWLAISTITRRFSAISLASVLLLAATGLANAWFLVGSPANLWHTRYGRVLLVKLSLFGLMVLIGAVNLLYLKPRLCIAPGGKIVRGETNARWLQYNVVTEVVLAMIVIVVVAVLGLLAPAIMNMADMNM